MHLHPHMLGHVLKVDELLLQVLTALLRELGLIHSALLYLVKGLLLFRDVL